MGTQLKAARVKTQESWITFTREADKVETITATEKNVLILRDANGDAIAFFNPLGWEHVEMEWEETDADS